MELSIRDCNPPTIGFCSSSYDLVCKISNTTIEFRCPCTTLTVALTKTFFLQISHGTTQGRKRNSVFIQIRILRA